MSRGRHRQNQHTVRRTARRLLIVVLSLALWAAVAYGAYRVAIATMSDQPAPTVGVGQ